MTLTSSRNNTFGVVTNTRKCLPKTAVPHSYKPWLMVFNFSSLGSLGFQNQTQKLKLELAVILWPSILCVTRQIISVAWACTSSLWWRTRFACFQGSITFQRFGIFLSLVFITQQVLCMIDQHFANSSQTPAKKVQEAFNDRHEDQQRRWDPSIPEEMQFLMLQEFYLNLGLVLEKTLAPLELY